MPALHAEINADATGINIRSRFSGSDFQIGENGGQTATQLGVRTLTGATRLDELNHGVGVPTKRDSFQQSPPAFNPDFTIVANDGTGPVNLVIDASSAEPSRTSSTSSTITRPTTLPASP